MRPFVLIIPESVNQLLTTENAPKDGPFLEDCGRLFGIVSEEQIDGHEILIITHYFKGTGRRRYAAHVDSSDSRTKTEEQLLANHLTECSRLSGFNSSGVVGLFHTHPDAADTSFSGDDRATFRRHALTTGSQFCIGPIGCRHKDTAYIKWFVYSAGDDKVYLLSNEMIHIFDDQELDQQFPGMARFIALNPSHILANTELSTVEDARSTPTPMPLRPLRYPFHTTPVPVANPDRFQPTTPGRRVSVLAGVAIFLLISCIAWDIASRTQNKAQATPDPVPKVVAFATATSGRKVPANPSVATIQETSAPAAHPSLAPTKHISNKTSKSQHGHRPASQKSPADTMALQRPIKCTAVKPSEPETALSSASITAPATTPGKSALPAPGKTLLLTAIDAGGSSVTIQPPQLSPPGPPQPPVVLKSPEQSAVAQKLHSKSTAATYEPLKANPPQTDGPMQDQNTKGGGNHHAVEKNPR